METSCSTSNLFISFFWNPSYLGLFLSICKFLIKVIALKKNSFAPLIDLFGTGRWWIFDRVFFFFCFFFVFFLLRDVFQRSTLDLSHFSTTFWGFFFSNKIFFSQQAASSGDRHADGPLQGGDPQRPSPVDGEGGAAVETVAPQRAQPQRYVALENIF